MMPKAPLPTVEACLADLEDDDALPAAAPPDPHSPILRLSPAELDHAILHAPIGASTLALLARDEGYTLASFGSGGPALAHLPKPFVATFGDAFGQVEGPLGHDRDTLARIIADADVIVFSVPDDAAAELAGLAAAAPDHLSLVIVTTKAARLGSWLYELRALRPALPILGAGLCRPPSATLN